MRIPNAMVCWVIFERQPVNKVQLLLDRSGSMSGTEQATTEAINGFLAQMQADKLGKDARFELTTFDSQGFDTLRRGQMSEVKPLQMEEFVPRAATPLYDAAGATIEKTEAGKCIFVFLTDGQENCSKKFTHEQVRKLIEAKRAAGWVFIYLAANIDAWKQAEDLGVPGELAMNYKQGVTTPPPAQPGQVTAKNRFVKHVADHPMGYALGTAALIGLAYLTFGSGDANAEEPTGFTDADRNAAMGVDGVNQTWQDAVTEDVANFVEPIPSDSFFDLPADVAEMQANLPTDFDPSKGSMINGEQAVDNGGDILSSDYTIVEADHTSAITEGVGEEGILDSIASGAESALDKAGELASDAGDLIGSAASGAVELAGDVASGALEVAGNVAGGLAEAAGSLLD